MDVHDDGSERGMSGSGEAHNVLERDILERSILDRDAPERGVSPALVLAKSSVRAAYQQGNGSLPIQFWDEDALQSPRSLGPNNVQVATESLRNTAPPPEFNFIPDTLVSESASKAATQLEAVLHPRRGFFTGAGGLKIKEQQPQSTESTVRYLF